MTTITTTNISEREFNEYDHSRRLFSHDNARRYACFELPSSKHTVAFNWRSDIIEPSVVVDEHSGTTWVGVDDRLAAVSKDGRIVVSLELIGQLLTIELVGEKAVVVCVLQALVMNGDGSIDATFDFPDAVDDFSINQHILSASFMDGTASEFNF